MNHSLDRVNKLWLFQNHYSWKRVVEPCSGVQHFAAAQSPPSCHLSSVPGVSYQSTWHPVSLATFTPSLSSSPSPNYFSLVRPQAGTNNIPSSHSAIILQLVLWSVRRLVRLEGKLRCFMAIGETWMGLVDLGGDWWEWRASGETRLKDQCYSYIGGEGWGSEGCGSGGWYTVSSYSCSDSVGIIQSSVGYYTVKNNVVVFHCQQCSCSGSIQSAIQL